MREMRVVTFETVEEVIKAMSNDPVVEGRERERVGANHSLMLHAGKRPHFVCSLDDNKQIDAYKIADHITNEDLILSVFKVHGQTPVGIDLAPEGS